MRTEFGTSLALVRDGRKSFDSFARETDPRWRGIARSIMRRWRLPTWHGIEDVVQDLLLGAHRAIRKYDGTKGVSLEGFVVWNAYDKAKKAAHKARGAVRSGNRADSNPSRFERNASSFGFSSDEGDGLSEAESWLDSLLAVDGDQEDRTNRREVATLLRSLCRSDAEHLVVEAIASLGDISIAEVAAAIYAEPDARAACRIDNEDHAVRVVRKTVVRLADRIINEESGVAA